MLARVKTPVRARADARPETTVAGARIPAEEREVAQRTDRSRQRRRGLCKLLRSSRAGTVKPALLAGADGSATLGATRFNNFTDCGVGIGLRAPHYCFVLREKLNTPGGEPGAVGKCPAQVPSRNEQETGCKKVHRPPSNQFLGAYPAPRT